MLKFIYFRHLILRNQVGAPVILKVVKVPEQFITGPCCLIIFSNILDKFLPIPEIISEKLNWKEDLELCSHFSDRKVNMIYHSFVLF